MPVQFDIPIPELPVHGSQSTLDLDASSECSERGGEPPGALPGASEAVIPADSLPLPIPKSFKTCSKSGFGRF